MAHSLRFYGDGISFQVVFGHHSNSGSFLVAHALLSQDECCKRDSGKWMDTQRLLSTFPNSSGRWWLISSVFLIRISCHNTTHANGYYGAWPGWAVSISVLPLTTQMVTLAGLFFTETDILTTRGKDQTQWPQLGPFCSWSPPDTDNWPECPDQ